MKLSAPHIPLSALLLLLTACSQSEPLSGEGEKALLRVSSLQTETTERTATRAVATPEYPTTGSIGFFVKKDATNGYTEMNNIKGTYSTTNTAWQPVDNIWLNNKSATVAVYAPYDATQTTASALKLTTALRPDNGKKDIWYARFSNANFMNSSPSLTLTHVYTRCVITVTRAASYIDDAKITTLDISGTEIYAGATFKPFESSPYDYTGAATGFAPAIAEKTLNASTASAAYDLLLIPAALNGDVTLAFTVNAKKMKLILAANKFPDSKLVAGKQYAINVSLREGELAVTEVTLTDWESVGIDGGDIGYI